MNGAGRRAVSGIADAGREESADPHRVLFVQARDGTRGQGQRRLGERKAAFGKARFPSEASGVASAENGAHGQEEAAVTAFF